MWDNTNAPTKVNLSSDGILQQNVILSALDGMMTISISNGTELLDISGHPLTSISVTPIEPPAEPPEDYHILKSFNFDPDGAEFDPGITVTISFDPSDVAEGETLVLAFYNETTDEWEFISGTDNGDGTATFFLTHFSAYSLMHDTVEDNSMGIWIWVLIGIGALLALLVVILLIRLRQTAKA